MAAKNIASPNTVDVGSCLYGALVHKSGPAAGVSKTWGRLVPDHRGGRDVADGAAAGEGEPERGEDDGAGADQPEMGKQPASGC